MAREDVVESALSSQSNALNGKSLDVQPLYEENSQEESRETGLKGLPAEEKARIGQLIKLLAQERRDKTVYRQKLDEQTVKLQALEQESQIGAKESSNKEAYRKRIDEQNARLRELEKECELGAKERRDKETFRQKVEEQSARLRALEQECRNGAQERCEQEAYRKKIDEQNVKLESLEHKCAIGRQQEQELLSRVSRSLHLLRSYQRELYMTKGGSRSEDKKETVRSAEVKDNADIALDRRSRSDLLLSDPKGQDASTNPSANSPSDRQIPAEVEKAQASVQTNPWHGGAPIDKCSQTVEAKLRATSAQEENPCLVGQTALSTEAKLPATAKQENLAGSSRLLGETARTNAQAGPLVETPLASVDPSDDVFTFGPLTQRHDARIRSRSPTGLRNMLSRFHSPRPPSEPVQSLSPPPRAGGSRSSSHAPQHKGLAHSLEPLVQSPPPRHVMPSNSPPHQVIAQSPPRHVLLSHPSPYSSPKPQAEPVSHAQPIFQLSRSRLDIPGHPSDHSTKLRLEPRVQSLWPLPLAATDAPGCNQVECSSEPLVEFLDSPRVQRFDGARTTRTSWPSVMQDGYYPSSMFDVLDSVESALSKGSSSLSQASSTKTATFGRSSSELSRLQKEITALELQVFGANAAETTGDQSEWAIAALNGAPMGTSGGLHAVSTEALARGMAKGKAITKSMLV